MFIKLDFGTRHPNALSTPLLLKEPAFRTIREQAEYSVRKRAGGSTEGELDDAKKYDQLIGQEVDDVGFFCRRTVLFVGRHDAAAGLRCW